MNVRVPQRPVAPTDRVSDVLARDESLVDVFARAAPHFATLRSPALRRVMARLVTVEQAARMADVSSDALVHDLNVALGIAPVARDTSAPPPRAAGAADAPADPPERSAERSAGPDAAGPGAGRARGGREVELDVRDELRAGREPFSKIMAAVNALAAGEVLHLRTPFAPVPLYAVMEKRGFVHGARAHAPGDWSVWFWRPGEAVVENGERGASARAAPTPEGHSALATRAVPAGVDAEPSPYVMWLDVRGLEPPEPLVRTLAALETLPAGAVLVQVNVRVPQFLLPLLAERGFACAIDDAHADLVLVRIWRTNQPPPAA